MDQNFKSLNLPTTSTAGEEQEEYYQSLLTDDESDSLSIISDSEVLHQSANSSTIEKHLFLSFEDILNGCKKKLDIQLVDKKGHQIDSELTCLRIKPGIESETRIAFNQFCNLKALQSDASLIVHDKPNQRFARLSNVDIEHTVFISQVNPNLSEIKIPTLESDPITLRLDDEDIDEIDSLIEVFSGRGLPDADDTSQRGNLIVRFEITNDQVKVDNRQVYQHFEDGDVTVLIIEHPGNATAFEPKEDVNSQESAFIEEAPLVKLPSNQYSLKLSLEELYNGCSKEEQITIQVRDAKENVHFTSKTVTVPILAGSIAGSQITLKEAGDQGAHIVSADAVFTVTELPHPLFRRIGNDLEVTSRITSTEACQGTTLRMRTLNNDNLSERIAGGITSKTIHTIQGYGMPISGHAGVFGHLMVKFDITLDEEKIQDPPIEHTIALSLEQIFTGCTRRVKITRIVIDNQNNEREEDKILSLTIKPGTRSGTRLSFPQEGDQYPGRIPADIHFIVRDKAHKRFFRKGAHLECTETVFRSQIINGDSIEVSTFKDGPKLITLNERNNWKRLPDLGLPYEEDSSRRGDLIVKFNIIDDPKDETIEYDLKLSLEEVVNGCTKKRKICRKTFDTTGREIEETSEILDIQIPSGVAEGRQFTFSQYGNRHAGVLPADISFIIRYKDHPHFDVIDGNLFYTVSLTVNEINQNISIEIPTLEKETLTIYSKAIHVNDVRMFANRGLPIGENAIERGPLSIKFSICDSSWKGLPVIEKLFLTPSQLTTGCVVKRKLTRQIVDKHGQSMGMETKTFHLNVQPKSMIGQELTFYRAASQLANQIPGDVIFQICQTNVNEPSASDESERSPIVETVVYQLPLSLVDILRGGIKHMSIERNVLQANGEIIPVRRSIEIPIVRGIETGVRIAFPGLGDERPGHPPGDIEFEVVDAAHSRFTRFGSDIQYTAKIIPSQIEAQDELRIPTIDGDSIPLKLTRQMVECRSKEIEGFGLPIAANSDCRGKLIVNFEIFPEQKLPNRKIANTRENTLRLHLSLTLEEIALGFNENITFTPDNFRQMKFQVNVQPGEQFGRELFFPKRQAIPVAASDVIIVLTEKRHQYFRRDGANLIYIARITFKQALNGGTTEVPLLKKGKIKLHLFPPIRPGDFRDIPNEGLPICGTPNKKGKLRVYFNIVDEENGFTKTIENIIGFFSP